MLQRKLTNQVRLQQSNTRLRTSLVKVRAELKEAHTTIAEKNERIRELEKQLGEKEDRVLISDFYRAYGSLPGENRFCWVHLLRDSEKAESSFHTDLKSFYHTLKEECQKVLSARNPDMLKVKLKQIAQKTYSDEHTNRIRKLQARIKKRADQLLTCLSHENVLPENNTAERAICNHVLMRKVFDGSRSLQGAKTLEINTSVLDTLRTRNPQMGFSNVVLPRLKELRYERGNENLHRVHRRKIAKKNAT